MDLFMVIFLGSILWIFLGVLFLGWRDEKEQWLTPLSGSKLAFMLLLWPCYATAWLVGNILRWVWGLITSNPFNKLGNVIRRFYYDAAGRDEYGRRL